MGGSRGDRPKVICCRRIGWRSAIGRRCRPPPQPTTGGCWHARPRERSTTLLLPPPPERRSRRLRDPPATRHGSVRGACDRHGILRAQPVASVVAMSTSECLLDETEDVDVDVEGVGWSRRRNSSRRRLTKTVANAPADGDSTTGFQTRAGATIVFFNHPRFEGLDVNAHDWQSTLKSAHFSLAYATQFQQGRMTKVAILIKQRELAMRRFTEVQKNAL